MTLANAEDRAGVVAGRRGINAGPLRLARQLELLTPVLVSMNKRPMARSGIAATGVDA